MIRGTTPKKVNSQIKQIIDFLKLDYKEVTFLKLTKESKFIPELNNCHINNLVKMKLYGGSIVFGWLFYQDRINDFTEAQFHSVWCNENGKLIDITPREDKEKRVMFLPDKFRKIETKIYKTEPLVLTYDNIRLLNGQFQNGIKQVLGKVGDSLAYEYKLVPAHLTTQRSQ
jgi:hypothetical protein